MQDPGLTSWDNCQKFSMDDSPSSAPSRLVCSVLRIGRAVDAPISSWPIPRHHRPVVAVQAVVRGYLTRVAVWDAICAATVIQAVARGGAARRALLLEEAEREAEHLAAILLQARARGLHVRASLNGPMSDERLLSEQREHCRSSSEPVPSNDADRGQLGAEENRPRRRLPGSPQQRAMWAWKRERNDHERSRSIVWRGAAGSRIGGLVRALRRWRRVAESDAHVQRPAGARHEPAASDETASALIAHQTILAREHWRRRACVRAIDAMLASAVEQLLNGGATGHSSEEEVGEHWRSTRPSPAVVRRTARAQTSNSTLAAVGGKAAADRLSAL